MKHRQIILAGWLLLGAMTGCKMHIQTGSQVGNGSDADLKATFTATNHASIPASLKTLVVENGFGVVKVTGSADDSFGWSQTVRVSAGTDAEAQNAASILACHAEIIGDTLKLKVTMPPSPSGCLWQSDLEIIVPNAISLHTKNQYGPTTITRLQGPVETKGWNGPVTISHISGEVQAEASYAALLVDHTGAATLKNQSGWIDASVVHGPLVAQTSYATLAARDISGPVTLRNQSGSVSVDRAGTADVRTSYATLRATEIIGDATLVNQSGSVVASAITGNVNATTSYAAMEITGSGPNFVCRDQSGSIQLHATSAALASVVAKTSYAALEIWLSGSLPNPAILAHTSYAAVESDFPVLAKPAGQDPFAVLPAGTPRISLENQSGKIQVVRE